MDRAGEEIAISTARTSETLPKMPTSTSYNENQHPSTSSSSKGSIRSHADLENGIVKEKETSGLDLEKNQRVTEAGGDDGEGEDQDEEDREESAEERDIERVASMQPSVNHVSRVPDGGLWAWLQVLGAFFLFFNSWGIINTFGSYQAYYVTDLLEDSSSSSISWIGSIQAFLLLVVGALTGPIYDRGYFNYLILGGSLLLVIGQMMLSLCHAYWQVLLAQAFCIGIGCGMLFIPGVAILSTYFTKRYATAMGLAASGSSFGGVIYPIVFHKLVPRIGFGWTTRAIGLIIIVTQLVPNLCMRVRVLPAKSRSLLDLRAFLIPAYTLDVVGTFIGFVGLYMPFFYAQVYALERNLTTPDLAFYLLAIMNSTSVFGRIIPNYLADVLGPFNVILPCTLISGVLCYSFIAVDSSASIIVLMAFYGFFSGTFVSLPPSIIVRLSDDARDKIGTRLGQSFACIAVGVLIGTPIGGAILDKSGFDAVWAFGGSTLIVSAAILAAARVKFAGWDFRVKA